MTAMTSAPIRLEPTSRILNSLAALTRAHPLARKRLVGPDVNYGRELLVALARNTGGWVGWEATNLRSIADSLAFVPLAERGVRVAPDVEIGALVNRALQRTVEAGLVGERFAGLARSLGFRRALRDTLLELRTAGIAPDEIRHGALRGSPAHELPAVLAEYERLLVAEQLADPAAVFRAALDAFDAESPYVLDGIVALTPWLPTRGLPGALLARLVKRGVEVLDGDVPASLAIPEQLVASGHDTREARGSLLAWAQASTLPALDEAHIDRDAVTVDMFSAATPSEEIREICRRVAAEGLRWDDVEIVATDPDAYGIALDALGQRIDVGATMLQGIPLARTRLGRALERWFAWLDDGLPADVLRQALEAGELHVPDAELSPTALARELRSLRIGWGRARYEAALVKLESGARAEELKPRDGESDEEFASRRASRGRTFAGLAALLRTLLGTIPQVPERGSDRPVRTSCAALARATSAYLALVPVHGPAEEQTMDRLAERLALLEEVDDGEESFVGALAALREALADLRAWPLITSDRKPWSASGGMPHLTDVPHAGTTGRRRVFVVGLDADRTSGPSRPDPLLPDTARRAIAPAHLATSVERRAEWVHGLGAALASLRGRVTLSYATSGALDGREAGPSPILLQTWRLATNDADLSYEDLRVMLRPPTSAVPARDSSGALRGIALLDTRDVWFDALTDGPLMLDGAEAVLAAFPMLAAGLTSQDLANGDVLTAYHGLVPDAGPLLDPMARQDREISPSSLEKLAACPLAWFYRYGLSLFPPDDPAYDAEQWLDALARGSLLHEVFEAFTREYQSRQEETGDDAARTRVVAIADAAIDRWREKVPPPAETVFEAEAAEIRGAALAFLQMERERYGSGDRGRWRDFELGFGSGDPSGKYVLGDGRMLLVRGRADRVDELPDGTLRVIDYKTGSPSRFARSPKSGPFNGGRQLQPAIYAAAVEAVSGGTVSRFEYRFPTQRGGNEIVSYSAEELAPAREIVSALLEGVRAGEFIPTNSSSDCGYCDYQAICRASRGEYNKTGSPRAEWAEQRADVLREYTTMLARRTPEISS